MAKTPRNLSNFAELVAHGENPNGFRGENPSGFAHGGIGGDYEQQWNWPDEHISGPRWDHSNPTDNPKTLPILTRNRRK
jgi:hypothetical protein